jgi:RNA polymerase sigma-B factor
MATVTLPPRDTLDFQRYRRTGDVGLRDALIERALPLAHQVARRYQRSSEPLEDIVQVARLGLVKAVERFDPDRGVAFSTYAVPTMLGEIKRYFRDTAWSVHMPRSLQERVFHLERAEKALNGRLGRAPSVEEVAEEARLTLEEALEGLQAASAYDARSLDAPAPAEGRDAPSYGESLGREDDGFELVEDRGAVRAALRILPLRERRILHMRFVEDMTQAEIARRVGVSQMQVSRLLRRSLQQLRDAAEGDEG